MGETNTFDPTLPPPDDSCPFCAIANTYKPFPPTSPPTSNAPDLDPFKLSPASFILLSTPTLIAFLDIMPLSRGHLLLCPRSHKPKLSDVSPSEAAEMGIYLRILSKALTRATCVHDWNVVQNNGAAAAQVVNHVHYHLIPRPEIRASGRLSESFTMFGRGQREELDDDEGASLAESIRGEIAAILEEEAKRVKL
ncbi:HIT domain-containing protein [Xylariaceae sp. FL0255]|nr:HIT domain-containing protein [Xylariaceae sp. FL0255]